MNYSLGWKENEGQKGTLITEENLDVQVTAFEQESAGFKSIFVSF